MFSQTDSASTDRLIYKYISTASPWCGNNCVAFPQYSTPVLTKDEKRAQLRLENKITCREWISTKAGRPYHLRKWYR